MYKQIIIVRKDLNMSHGKMAAQVSHASMAFLTRLIQNHYVGDVLDIKLNEKDTCRIETFDIDKRLFDEWINGTFTKVILEAKNKNQLLKAKTLAEENGMIEDKDFFLIRDNCYTELTPEDEDGRTLTCIGFTPMDADKIDKIGKKFHTYVG